MTTQHYLDSIKSIFPNIPDTQILKDIDKSQKLFSTETGLLTAQGELSSISTNFAWVLPTGFRKLLDVKMYDSSVEPLYFGGEDLNIAYEIQLDKFYVKSLTSTPISAVPSGVDKMYLIYETLPADILTQDTALEIAEEFRDAIEHDILRKYFAKYPTITSEGTSLRDWNGVKYHDQCYRELRVKAKRYINSKEKTLGDVWNYQDAGRVRLPLRNNDTAYSSTTIVQVAALGEIYEKFVQYNINTADSGVLTPVLSVGYTTISASKSGVTVTVTSTAEFGNDTFIISNNADASWVQNSSSEIVITLPGSFTDISIQIFEMV